MSQVLCMISQQDIARFMRKIVANLGGSGSLLVWLYSVIVVLFSADHGSYLLWLPMVPQMENGKRGQIDSRVRRRRSSLPVI